jgi:sec-independent protein translocase protein TatA
MPGWVSPWELLILLAFVLLLFGPKRLPEMGRSLGKGMREFKDSIAGRGDEDERQAELAAPPPEEQAASVTTPSARERDTVS